MRHTPRLGKEELWTLLPQRPGNAGIPELLHGNPWPSWATKTTPGQEPRSSADPDDWHHDAHHSAPSGVGLLE